MSKAEVDVTFYAVCYDTEEDGKRIIGKQFSPRFATRELAVEALEYCRQSWPDDVYLARSEFYFRRDSVPDRKRINELKATIQTTLW